ncbi:peptidoglycan bridge formation glycyltransferase FemA/FemB family protein, partial [Acetobacterium fimetarium]
MLVITHQYKEKWNNIVKSFSNWDIYYLHEYAVSFMKHGDGIPLLFYYEAINCRMCYVDMLNDISEMTVFNEVLLAHRYFDLTTPYGYGGPMVEGDFDPVNQKKFLAELNVYCVKNKIVSQFIRFHPLLNNQIYMKDLSKTVELKKTITIDTTTPEIINNNMISKCRNMVRKAKKLGVSIKYDTGDHIDEFIRLYELTMKENNASSYYYFKQEYYDYLISDLTDNTIYFYSYVEDIMISAAIFFYNDKYMHYHLSGTRKEYRHLASMNLLLAEAALWASDRGIKFLHLGGGVGDMDSDSLFKFKKQFNRNGELPFYIGRNIFDIEAYNE